MKRIILLELCLLFLATTFKGDNPPQGWYIQQIPVNKNIVDIYFTDTLHGWAVTGNLSQLDSGYILKTTNGGINWLLNYAINRNLFAIQFLDTMTGYTCGGWGTGKFYKTTNSGNNWNLILSGGIYFTDLYFLNKDTGWVCDGDNAGIGLLKTTNGGINWVQQLNQSYSPKKLFYLNKDTGWVMCVGGGIYRTNNSGANWIAIYNFGGTVNLFSMFFTSSDTGWVVESQFVYKTVNSGYNWQSQTIPSNSYPQRIFLINSKYGYLSTGLQKIMKTIDGINWQQQNAPSGGYDNLFFTDSLYGWVYHGSNKIVATVDGGGPVVIVNNIITEVPKEFELEQNYPNPFNSISNIKYKISSLGGSSTSYVKIIVYDIIGREIQTIVNDKYTPGTYEVNFNGNNISSGVYFYSLFADGKKIDTKRMILLK